MGAALFFILLLAIIVIALFAPRNMGDINFCHRCGKGLKSPSKLCSECRPNKKNSTQKNFRSDGSGYQPEGVICNPSPPPKKP